MKAKTKYVIEYFDDDTVIVWGYLETLELIEISMFYYEKGFTDVLIGRENSSLHLSRPERLSPEDTCVKKYYRSDDGVYEKLEPCVSDSLNQANK